MAVAARHEVVLDRAEMLVLSQWLAREVGRREGANLGAALEHPAELAALQALHEVVEIWLQADGGPRDLVAAARAWLTPEETHLPIDARGLDDRNFAAPSKPGARTDGRLDAPAAVTMASPVLLVLFEFLCREIEEREGENMLDSFVGASEFWALNNLQCVLEKGEFYSVLLPYPEQVAVARTIVKNRNNS